MHSSLFRAAARSGAALVASLVFSLSAAHAFDHRGPRVETSAYASSFAQCPQFFAEGRPPVVQRQAQQRELCYEAFAVLHNGNTRTPLFVAQRLSRQSLQANGGKRSDTFFADARLPRSERAELEDYRRSGYSRGHMAPAGDMPSPTAMAQSFSLANMVPQNANHNSGAWAKIEQDTRRYILRAQGDVYVITGPVFSRTSPRIGPNGVAVPSHLYKLVYDATSHRAWAHWQANQEGEKAGRPISYRELVERTGIDFLPHLRPQP
ncbi:DNA/RNA non-specific endonuclease [Variovorax sp. HJSM1_2]|uniref:DNA/RNA non-specific endonuclease n=1 Tax=Variovorax sp. HJSM1_2 TaxID=3366263 RepID=UPI003BD8B563